MFSQVCVCHREGIPRPMSGGGPPYYWHLVVSGGSRVGLTPITDIWLSSLETCSNWFTQGHTPHWYWHLVVATETRTFGKRAACILLKCFLVVIVTVVKFLIETSYAEELSSSVTLRWIHIGRVSQGNNSLMRFWKLQMRHARSVASADRTNTRGQWSQHLNHPEDQQNEGHAACFPAVDSVDVNSVHWSQKSLSHRPRLCTHSWQRARDRTSS